MDYSRTSDDASNLVAKRFRGRPKGVPELISCIVIPKMSVRLAVLNGPTEVVGRKGQVSLICFSVTNFRESNLKLELVLTTPESWIAWPCAPLFLAENFGSLDNKLRLRTYLFPKMSKLFPINIKFPRDDFRASAFRVEVKELKCE